MISTKTEHSLSYNSSVSFLGINPEEMSIYPPSDMYKSVHSSFIDNIQELETRVYQESNG